MKIDDIPTAILTEVESFRALDEVLRWALAKTPPARVAKVVAQDEFTHDVVLRLEEKIYLAFDTT
ncbi:MAG: hypothetical protein HY231_12180 [Acidobacteria bacterium]|nr:hypothetical protein [Acidobacteriota bacterium]